jgi:hypothetical protein
LSWRPVASITGYDAVEADLLARAVFRANVHHKISSIMAWSDLSSSAKLASSDWRK